MNKFHSHELGLDIFIRIISLFSMITNKVNLLSYKTHIDILINYRMEIIFESIIVIHWGIWTCERELSAVTTTLAGDIPTGITGGSGGFVDVPFIWWFHDGVGVLAFY